MLFLEIQRNDLVVRGITRRLPHSQQQPQHKQRGERMHNPRRGRSRRPQKERAREHPVDVQAVHQPPVEKMQTRVRPEERGKQHAKLRRRNSQLVLEHRRGDGEVAAIDVIDEHGNRKQNDDNQEGAGNALALGWPESGHEGSATSSPQRPCFATCLGVIWGWALVVRPRAERSGDARLGGVARQELSSRSAGAGLAGGRGFSGRDKEWPARLPLERVSVCRHLASYGAALVAPGPLKQHIDQEIHPKNAKRKKYSEGHRFLARTRAVLPPLETESRRRG